MIPTEDYYDSEACRLKRGGFNYRQEPTAQDRRSVIHSPALQRVGGATACLLGHLKKEETDRNAELQGIAAFCFGRPPNRSQNGTLDNMPEASVGTRGSSGGHIRVAL